MSTTEPVLANLYLSPANWIIDWLLLNSPGFSELIELSDSGASSLALMVIATCAWFIALLAAFLAFRIIKRAITIANGTFIRALYRVRVLAGELKTALICKLKRDRPKRVAPLPNFRSVTFTDFDLAVLHAAAALRPAESMSALELSTTFRLRPAQLQESLEKLARNNLLDYAFGSTEGFDTYVLSAAGAAYFSNFSRDADTAPEKPAQACRHHALE